MNIEVGRVSFSLIGRKPNNTIGPLAAFSVNDIVVAMEKRAENMLVRPKLFDIFSSFFMFFFFFCLVVFFLSAPTPLIIVQAQLDRGQHRGH